MYAQKNAGQGQPGPDMGAPGDDAGGAKDDDDVVDADYTEVK